MQIVISHLTRMAPGFFCFVGIDLDTKRSIRPIITGSRLPMHFITRQPDLYRLRSIIDIGNVASVGIRPETEDHEFKPDFTKLVGRMLYRDFWNLLYSQAKPSLFAIFGKPLKCRHTAYYVETGSGDCSTGYFFVRTPMDIRIENRLDGTEQVRVSGSTKHNRFDLGVTDLRFYDENGNVRRDVVEHALIALEKAKWVMLCVGLTRPFASGENYAPVHWVQVNNILFYNEPNGFST